MVILPSVYLGSVEYFARLAQQGDECVVDLGENYVKRSERNRAGIMTANGVMELSVHLRNANRPRTPMRDMRIDYSKRWQHQHWVAIMSAYRSSAYFDYYAPMLEPFYTRRYEFLADYNTELTRLLMRAAGCDAELHLSDAYVEASDGDIDMRAKKRESTFVSPRYFQLFSDRFPFVSGLSVLDLLMSEGPSSIDVLRGCRW